MTNAAERNTHATYFDRANRFMQLDKNALSAARETFARALSEEAAEQHAYLARFPDGRISVQLEWIDIEPIVQAVIAAYIAQLSNETKQAPP